MTSQARRILVVVLYIALLHLYVYCSSIGTYDIAYDIIMYWVECFWCLVTLLASTRSWQPLPADSQVTGRCLSGSKQNMDGLPQFTCSVEVCSYRLIASPWCFIYHCCHCSELLGIIWHYLATTVIKWYYLPSLPMPHDIAIVIHYIKCCITVDMANLITFRSMLIQMRPFITCLSCLIFSLITADWLPFCMHCNTIIAVS